MSDKSTLAYIADNSNLVDFLNGKTSLEIENITRADEIVVFSGYNGNSLNFKWDFSWNSKTEKRIWYLASGPGIYDGKVIGTIQTDGKKKVTVGINSKQWRYRL